LVVGVFLIFIGLIGLLIAPRKADNMAEKFRQFNSEIDPGIFKFALVVPAIAAIIWGAVEITKALR